MRLTPVLLLVLAAAPLSAQQGQTVSHPASAAAAIRIDNPAGAVRLTGWDRDSISVTTTLGSVSQHLRVGGSRDSLTVTIEGSTLTSADLELRVPAAATLWIRTATGEIDADQLTGRVTALTIGGRLRVGGRLRSVSGESLEGNIELAADADSATARGGSGTVVLRGSMANAVATSVSGAILVGLTGPLTTGRFESLSGNVSYKGPLRPDGTLEVQSHSGDLDLRMSPTLGATYDIETYGGTINDALTGGATRVLKGNTVLTVGNGQAKVTIRNFKGTVTIQRQETVGARR